MRLFFLKTCCCQNWKWPQQGTMTHSSAGLTMISVKSMDKRSGVTQEMEDLQSCNCTTEVFVRSGPCYVSITVHLLITSNPQTWLSIVGYSSHDFKSGFWGAWLIPAAEPRWGLISLPVLTSRATGFKSESGDSVSGSELQILRALRDKHQHLDRYTAHPTRWHELSCFLPRYCSMFTRSPIAFLF